MQKPIQAARLFAALADPTRLALLVTLRSGTPRSIARLSATAGMTRQAVTKHLRILEAAALVSATREGRETHYTYRPAALDTARTALDAIAGNWTAVTPAPFLPGTGRGTAAEGSGGGAAPNTAADREP